MQLFMATCSQESRFVNIIINRTGIHVELARGVVISAVSQHNRRNANVNIPFTVTRKSEKRQSAAASIIAARNSTANAPNSSHLSIHNYCCLATTMQ